MDSRSGWPDLARSGAKYLGLGGLVWRSRAAAARCRAHHHSSARRPAHPPAAGINDRVCPMAVNRELRLVLLSNEKCRNVKESKNCKRLWPWAERGTFNHIYFTILEAGPRCSPRNHSFWRVPYFAKPFGPVGQDGRCHHKRRDR